MSSAYTRTLRGLLQVRDIQKMPNPIVRALLPREEVSYAGCRFLTCPGENYTQYRLWLNSTPPEHEATEYLCDIFRGREITMLDIGANAGLFSLPIARAAAPASRFVLFEPNPAMCDRLLENSAQRPVKC